MKEIQKDKHGFTVTKHKISFRIVLKFILTVIVCAYALYRCSIRAFAAPSNQPDSTHSVTLTPAQTLALYGTEFTALVGNRNNNNNTAITFQYAFPLSSIGFMDLGGGFSPDYFANSSLSIQGSSLTAQEIKDIWCGTSGLVYVAEASQWGNTAFSPYGHDNNANSVQLHIPFSIQIPQITRFKQNVFFSTKRNADYQTPYAYPQYDIFKVLTDIANVDFTAVRGAFSNYYVSARAEMPTYSYYSGENQIVHDSMGYFAGWEIDLYEDEYTPTYFSISGATIDCYCLSSVSNDSNNIWLIIGCPTLYNYQPPVVTTTRPAETIPAATFPVATMPTDVTDVPLNVINQNLVTNNYQLNLVIGQLNLIYAQLKANGELNARLAAALDPDIIDGASPPVNSGLYAFMQSALATQGTFTGETASQSTYDLRGGMSTYFDIGNSLLSSPLFRPFVMVAAVGLSLAVMAFVLFRGH